MKRIIFVTIALFAVLILAFATVSASEHDSGTVTIPASKDNTLFEHDSGSLSNGMGSYFFAGKAADQEIRRGVIAFDLPDSIPSNAIITRAELKLHMSKSRAGQEPVAVHRCWLIGGKAHLMHLGRKEEEHRPKQVMRLGYTPYVVTSFGPTAAANPVGISSPL